MISCRTQTYHLNNDFTFHHYVGYHIAAVHRISISFNFE
nr:MAG TPA: hypothetical protein [Podoviridae sp. ctY3D12]DAL01566.1 MAG TPA: hypothetical protein [Caudoviricetes sp.]